MALTVKEITEKLEKGVHEVLNSEKYTECLRVMSKFYRYSTNNCIMIVMQKPDASLVAGYRKWEKEFNRNVKKGEKAIRILAPIPHKFNKTVTNDKGEQEEVEVKYMTFKEVPVFDVSQTEGKELPTYVSTLKGDVDRFDELINRVVSLSPVPVEYEEIKNGANGFFSPMENRIVVKTGMSQMQTVKTMIHEIAHATLHCKDGEEANADRETKEVQAESIAYTVCDWLGLDTSDYSFGYVAGWGSGKETKELVASMDVIRKTAGEFIEKLKAVA